MKSTKKVLSLVLALCMVFALSVSAFAADNETTTSGGTATSNVQLTAAAANFKVTVPTAFVFSVAADGTVTTATSAAIANESNGQVKVTAVKAVGNEWAIVGNGTDFTAVPVNTKQFTMTLNGDNFPAAAAGADSALSLGSAWTVIDGGDSLALPYAGDFAEQATALSGANIASVMFTVDWNTAA